MSTKVVSFRLPTADYARLLLEAEEKKMALSDYVITKVYGPEKNVNVATQEFHVDYKHRYMKLLKLLVDAIDTEDVFEFGCRFHKGNRILEMNSNVALNVKEEYQILNDYCK